HAGMGTPARCRRPRRVAPTLEADVSAPDTHDLRIYDIPSIIEWIDMTTKKRNADAPAPHQSSRQPPAATAPAHAPPPADPPPRRPPPGRPPRPPRTTTPNRPRR